MLSGLEILLELTCLENWPKIVRDLCKTLVGFQQRLFIWRHLTFLFIEQPARGRGGLYFGAGRWVFLSVNSSLPRVPESPKAPAKQGEMPPCCHSGAEIILYSPRPPMQRSRYHLCRSYSRDEQHWNYSKETGDPHRYETINISTAAESLGARSCLHPNTPLDTQQLSAVASTENPQTQIFLEARVQGWRWSGRPGSVAGSEA